MNPMRFEIRPAKGGWCVHFLNVRNSKIIFWTQVYDDIRDANYAVALAKAYAATAPVVPPGRLTQRAS